MKRTWKEIQEIADRNAVFMDGQPEQFLNGDASLAERDLILLLWLLLDDFETEDGRLKKNTKNFFLVNGVDAKFRMFTAGAGFALISKLLNRYQKIVNNNVKFYSQLLGTGDPFNPTKERITKMVNRRLGINTDGSLTPDGFLNTLNTDSTIRNTTKELLYKAVLAENKVSDTRSLLEDYIVSKDERVGAIKKFYSLFAYDSFTQIDRMASAEFAKQYGLTKFYYAGIIIPTSRKFCRKKINGIYTLSEAEKWPYENPHPIGISNATYDPAVDLGGVNCKHLAIFLTDEMADEAQKSGIQKVLK